MIKHILLCNVFLYCLILCQANTYNYMFSTTYLKDLHDKKHTNKYLTLIKNKDDICFKNESLHYNLFNSYINKNINTKKYFIENNSDNYNDVLRNLIIHEYKSFTQVFDTTLNIGEFLSYYGL